MADLIEVSLQSFQYHFRRLTWIEEVRLSSNGHEDQRRSLLAQALVDVSGLQVSPEDAAKILAAIPEALLWRIWLVYRGNLPDDRYYTTEGLYQAPDPMNYRKEIERHEAAVEAVADAASTQVERTFGRTGLNDAEDISRQMFRQAQRSVTLTRAGENAHGQNAGHRDP